MKAKSRRNYSHGNRCIVCEKLVVNSAKRCRRCNKLGSRSRSWNGGVKNTTDGRVRILFPQSRMADKRGYVLRSRVVMSNMLERDLLAEEVVHHENKDRKDDAPENLSMYESNGSHVGYHNTLRKAE